MQMTEVEKNKSLFAEDKHVVRCKTLEPNGRGFYLGSNKSPPESMKNNSQLSASCSMRRQVLVFYYIEWLCTKVSALHNDEVH